MIGDFREVGVIEVSGGQQRAGRAGDFFFFLQA
jgi:hypothetical protein